MSDQKYEQGMKTRRSVLGDRYVDQAEANKTDFDTDFQQYITESAWGSVWSRPHLDHRTRHMITIALLAAGGHEHELAAHLRGTRNTGVTAEDLKEVFLHVAVYAGVPAANTAVRVAKQVYSDWKDEK
jgi:4-carboxymuconolactone decarboxylase